MTSHSLRLHDAPFRQIARGDKTIEARLYDKKRQTIKIGDQLTFTNRSFGDVLSVTVTALHLDITFQSLFAHSDPHTFGGDSAKELEEVMRAFYSLEEQAEFGVVGIEFKLVS